MKISCLISSMRLGGAEKQLVGLASTLSEAGHQVEVITYREGNFYDADLDEASVETYRPKHRSSALIICEVANHLRQRKTDLLISFLVGSNLKACFIKLLCPELKLFVSERNYSLKVRVHDALRFKLYEHFADKVICNNFSQSGLIRSVRPSLSSKVLTIPNFVSTPSTVEYVVHKVPDIVVTARISKRKNALGLIEAAAILKERGYTFNIEWFGRTRESHYLKTCRKRIKGLGLDEVFAFRDASSNTAAIYSRADFFCLPSFYEGTSNSLSEALASGVPVICSAVGDNMRYVSDAESGFLFNPYSPLDIANAIERALILSPEQRIRFSAKARASVTNRLSPEKFRDSYLELILS